MTKILEWYNKRIPKGVRFTIHIVTAPVWLPATVVFSIIAFIIVAPLIGLIEYWNKFK